MYLIILSYVTVLYNFASACRTFTGRLPVQLILIKNMIENKKSVPIKER